MLPYQQHFYQSGFARTMVWMEMQYQNKLNTYTQRRQPGTLVLALACGSFRVQSRPIQLRYVAM
jgi:hypothetical protein